MYGNTYDGPRPYNYEPAMRERGRDQDRVLRNNGQRREVELWCSGDSVENWAGVLVSDS